MAFNSPKRTPRPESPLQTRIDVTRIAQELFKCVKKDQLIKARFILRDVKIEERQNIVCKLHDGSTPLFVAAQQGQVHFVNFLISDCGADIEQRGVYEVQDDKSRHQVTPLWCASVANKLEVVKTLIRHNADVNATSDTQSTPVRSACYMTNLNIVKFLVENGADIHKPNVNGGTCLINSVQSVELCRFLIEKGANVNAQDNSGNLALHYAIREGRAETVKLLMKHSSDPYIKNDFGDDAIQTAALRGFSDILEYLINKMHPPIMRQIEAYELLGTNFVDEKHDINRALQAWRHAMELRYKDPNKPLLKPTSIPKTPAYQYAEEVLVIKELEGMAAFPDSIYMQALLMRERILGPDHKDTIFGLMYRGAVYADMHRYQRCVDLWKYSFQLRHQKQEPLNHECLFTLQALCKLFWEIYEEHKAGFTNEEVQFDDVIEVFEMSIQEVEAANKLLVVRPIYLSQQEEFHTLLLLALHMIHLLHKLSKTDGQALIVKRLVHKLVRVRARGLHSEGLLHLAINFKYSCISDEIFSYFPSLNVIKILVECGQRLDEMDDSGSTPLHVCLPALKPGLISTELSIKTVESIVDFLLSEGAHIDIKDRSGVIVGDALAKSSYRLYYIKHVTLKCLAAQVIQRYKLKYEGEVPVSLVPFIELH